MSSELPGFFAAGADIKHMTSVDAAEFKAVRRRTWSGSTGWPRIRPVDRRHRGSRARRRPGTGDGLHAAGRRADAKLGLPEVKLGLIPGPAVPTASPAGRPRAALDIMLTGRQVDTTKHFEWADRPAGYLRVRRQRRPRTRHRVVPRRPRATGGGPHRRRRVRPATGRWLALRSRPDPGALRAG